MIFQSYQVFDNPSLNIIVYPAKVQGVGAETTIVKGLEALDKLKQHTRNYAKRQLTWFRKNPELEKYCRI